MRLILGFLFLLISQSTVAENAGNSIIKGFSSFGLGLVGEDLVQTDGDSKLTTAGLLHLSYGALLKIPDSQFEIQTAVGFNYDELRVTQGKYSFTKWSVEAIPFYRINSRTRIGLGLFHVLSAELSGPESADFGGATGLAIEINWKTGNKKGWGFRYIDIDLPIDRLNGSDVSAFGDTHDGSYFSVVSYHQFR